MTTFQYMATIADWWRIAPVLVIVGMTLIVMLVDLLLPHSGERSKHSGPSNFAVLPILAFIGVLGAVAATIVLFIMGDQQTAFYGMIGSDQGALYAYLIILSAAGLGIFLSPAYLKRLELVHQGEYYALMLFATAGMMLLSAATSFVTVFLGLELLSLALYILCSYVARRRSSQESGMKYFLLSSFASAFLLYGIAMIYGATGFTSFSGVAEVVRNVDGGATSSILLWIAMGLLAVGFAFKISAIPFQAWTPDVYQGAPAPVTAFMSVATKAAAIIAFARVFDAVLFPLRPEWLPVIWTLAILTMVGGNIMALIQSNIKRMLAYSSIAHAGYLLIGVAVGDSIGISAILFYMFCYAFMTVGAFGVITMWEKADNSGSDASDLRGLWYRQPILAGLLAFFLLSLAGFPPMAGFAAKYYLFLTAFQGGHPELLIIGVLTSILGMYYYLRFIAIMFMERDKVAESAPAGVPATPTTVPTTPRRVPRSPRPATGGLSTSGSTTAVAEKTARSTALVEEDVEEEEPAGRLTIMSWISLSLATLGTLAMGTILPYWFIPLAVQAAASMLK